MILPVTSTVNLHDSQSDSPFQVVVGFPVRTVNAVEPVSLAALGTLDALGLAFLAVCAGPPRLGLCCQGQAAR